jgi:hypothetical protein
MTHSESTDKYQVLLKQYQKALVKLVILQDENDDMERLLAYYVEKQKKKGK